MKRGICGGRLVIGIGVGPPLKESEGETTRLAHHRSNAHIEYAAFAANPEMYQAGKVVLFFHAGWCPTCQEANKNLTSDPASLPAGVTVVKTDFDTETDLRQKYGVGIQHTFVQIDADGNELRTWTGSNTGEEIARKTV